MSADVVEQDQTPAPETEGGLWTDIRAHRDDILRGIRWGASALWVLFAAHEVIFVGIPFDREGLLAWIAAGVTAFSIGRRKLRTVIFDWLPFAAVLIAYDYLRGLSDTLGMPTWWHPQIDVDRFLCFGHEPTVWLQEHLKYPDVRWWDVVVCLCYVSFFLLPYVTAGVLWMRSRADFYRWSLRFVGLSFLGFTLFALIPAAPPWAAAVCSAQDVAKHPANPSCMSDNPKYVPGGGILGQYSGTRAGAHPWFERLSGRGWSELHLSTAQSLLSKGQGTVDLIAAVPSLHLGGTTLFCIFMWRRLNKWWRPLLVAYPIVMTFSLVYSGEHYLSDCLAGALAAVLVCFVAGRVERWRKNAHAVDTLDDEQAPEPSLESQCPPTETIPSSI
jgi:hypothetical protein